MGNYETKINTCLQQIHKGEVDDKNSKSDSPCLDIIEPIAAFIENATKDRMLAKTLFKMADDVRRSTYGNHIFVRGLIEFTNYCKQDCYYCGIRKSNTALKRFRLDEGAILSACQKGYSIGFRTFVLQGGEDAGFSDERMTALVRKIKTLYPDCALTLSVGERPKKVYEDWFAAGANRFLLRHETANEAHFAGLHPKEQSLVSRKACLFSLKEIGFQTGAGMMIGSPGQSVQTLAEDLLLLQTLRPQMVGIGPFIPQADTPFANESAGSLDLTLIMLSLVRLMLPKVLLPATTALASIDPRGRELGLKAGANVIMPNLSPDYAKEQYRLYDGKLSTGLESAEGLNALKEEVAAFGYELVLDRGDYPRETK